MKRALEILEALKNSEQKYYTYERNAVAVSTFIEAGAETTIVAVGGYRLKVVHLDGLLVSITPKATSAGRGHYIIQTKYSNNCTTEIAGHKYDHDPCGGMRLRDALVIAGLAWETSGGNIDNFYKAIGARGNCACCGAFLSDELSLARGIGPECIKKVYARPMIKLVQKKNLAAA